MAGKGTGRPRLFAHIDVKIVRIPTAKLQPADKILRNWETVKFGSQPWLYGRAATVFALPKYNGAITVFQLEKKGVRHGYGFSTPPK